MFGVDKGGGHVPHGDCGAVVVVVTMARDVAAAVIYVEEAAEWIVVQSLELRDGSCWRNGQVHGGERLGGQGNEMRDAGRLKGSDRVRLHFRVSTTR